MHRSGREGRYAQGFMHTGYCPNDFRQSTVCLTKLCNLTDESYDVSDVEAFAAAHQSPSDTMGDGTAAAPTLSKPGLLVMDVDSTLIDEEVIDELGEAAGSGRRR